MNTKIKKINKQSSGFVEGLRDFLKLLEDMERKKEKVRNVSGEFKGPFDSKGKYNYTVKIGIEKDDTVSVVADLPHIREEDIELEIAGSRLLRITAVTPDGDLVRNIPVSEEENIEGIKEASFKNGILMIQLNMKEFEVR
jgi:HSP20 family molecular chaperone IbpA